MTLTIIAAIARNGVIGRTSKTCEACTGTGLIYGSSLCPKSTCDGTGRVPCNDMPWSYPEDLKCFKALTTGSTVIMGRQTHASIGRILPNRTNIVITSRVVRPVGALEVDAKAKTLGIPLIFVPSFEAALEAAQSVVSEQGEAVDAFAIGGRAIFEASLPLADTLELTLIERDYEGDVLFPGWDTEPTTLGMTTAYGRALTTFASRGGGWMLADAVSSADRPEMHPDLMFTTWRRR
jgi:dihydrofolate reductase